MIGLRYIEKIREYCDYVERHLQNVAASWERIQDACWSERFVWDDFYFHVIDALVKEHDLSKFSTEEFIQYQRNFYPVDGDKSEADREAFRVAWAHHEASNPHHWQNWTRDVPWKPWEQECHCVTMVIDWMAMGIEFGDTAESYYEANRDKIHIPKWAESLLATIFQRLREYDSRQPTPHTNRARARDPQQEQDA